MGLSWLMNDFICKDLYAPYIIDKDTDYYDSLKKKSILVLKQAEKANADSESIAIIKKYSKKILESMRAYYNADLSKSCTIIRNLILDLGDDPFAVNTLSSSDAFFTAKMRNYSFLDAELESFQLILKPKICYTFLKIFVQSQVITDLVFLEIQVCI